MTALRQTVHRIIDSTPAYDIHTHLFDPAFGTLCLWGIDELLTYHYLIAEGLRTLPITPAQFFAATKPQQADLIWDTLFTQRSPITEAARGILTVLHSLGLDVNKRDLPALRQWFTQQDPADYLDRTCHTASIRAIAMTNSPFDDHERATWQRGFHRDPRFRAALRIDQLLLDWPTIGQPSLTAWGYQVNTDLTGPTYSEIRRFLADWTLKIQSQYCMASLPPDFTYPAHTHTARIIEHALMPHCREHRQPFAMMIGVRRAVHPALHLAGDSLGTADVTALERLCATYPANKFLCTMLARENQHPLCIAARKFPNLHIFGCWWFMNIPTLITEITQMRLQLLGLSITPQHSDSRVLDQLTYKWAHSRPLIASALADQYEHLTATGWHPTEPEIQRDAHLLLGGAFEQFLAS